MEFTAIVPPRVTPTTGEHLNLSPQAQSKPPGFNLNTQTQSKPPGFNLSPQEASIGAARLQTELPGSI